MSKEMQGSLAERLCVLRARAGLSQEALAHTAGLSLNTVHKLERGVSTDPHLSTLRGVARALEIPVEELLQELAGKAEQTEATT